MYTYRYYSIYVFDFYQVPKLIFQKYYFIYFVYIILNFISRNDPHVIDYEMYILNFKQSRNPA